MIPLPAGQLATPVGPPVTERDLATVEQVLAVEKMAGPPGADASPCVPCVDGTDGTDGIDGDSVTVFVQLGTPTALRTGDVWIKV